VNIDAAKRRRAYVLDRMAELHYITQEQAQIAKAKPIVLRGDPGLDETPAPYFLEEVRKQLEAKYGAKVLYDAHEFWPRSVMEFRHWEVEFWSAFDRNLAQRADLRVTVSPQLAEVMAREYGCDFLSLPNCVSRGSVPPVDLDAALQRSATREQVVFIFLGVFTTGRGIEDLIAAWRHVDRRGLLVLQGPEGAFRTDIIKLARAHGMLDERRRREIPEDLGTGGDALRIKPGTRNPVGHCQTSLS
jgi:glycosyltransferase involved in cell wall biosynthesis